MAASNNDPQHVANLNSNIAEVMRLVDIHSTVTGNKPGRRHNMGILNKSGIVLAVSCWEAFVEDLAANAFDFLLAKATTPTVFPRGVLALASRELRDGPNPLRVWELADAGWRSVLLRHKEQILKKSVGRLNTPRTKQVDELFGDLIGLAFLSNSWRWHNVPNTKVKGSLEELVTLRGEIAHRVVSSRSVRKQDVKAAAELVTRLAVVSSNVVRTFLVSRTDHAPWGQYHVAD